MQPALFAKIELRQSELKPLLADTVANVPKEVFVS
jgi:hypothetical protein